MKLKIFVAAALSLVAIQLVPYGRDHANPSSMAEPPWDSPATRTTFFKLCGDCHSHATVWPFYSSVAPASWLVQHDVDEGREHFNVSMWNVQKKNRGDKAAEEYGEGEMPPWVYLIPRPGNRLSAEDRAAFVKGLQATFGSKGATD